MKVYVPKAIYELLREDCSLIVHHSINRYINFGEHKIVECSDEAALQLEGLGDKIAEKESKDNKIKELEAERKELASKIDKVDKELSELSGVGPFSYRHCLPHGAEGKVDKEFKVGDRVYCERYKKLGIVIGVDVSEKYPVNVRINDGEGEVYSYASYTLDGRPTFNSEIVLKKV